MKKLLLSFFFIFTVLCLVFSCLNENEHIGLENIFGREDNLSKSKTMITKSTYLKGKIILWENAFYTYGNAESKDWVLNVPLESNDTKSAEKIVIYNSPAYLEVVLWRYESSEDLAQKLMFKNHDILKDFTGKVSYLNLKDDSYNELVYEKGILIPLASEAKFGEGPMNQGVCARCHNGLGTPDNPIPLDGPVITPGGGNTGGGNNPPPPPPNGTWVLPNGGAQTPCSALSKQLEDTTLLRVLQNKAKKSSTEEGYSEEKDITKNSVSTFNEPLLKEKGKVSFKVEKGVVGFVHSHTVTQDVKGFYSLADVRAFFALANLTHSEINNEKDIKSYSMYDIYSTLLYDEQIYTMKIDNVELYQDFYKNKNGIRAKIMSDLDNLYKNNNEGFNHLFDGKNFTATEVENQAALNLLSEKILSKIGVRVYKLENLNNKKKRPGWKKLAPSSKGNGEFINPC
ncbi:hypothetical protein ACNFNZ_12735 [Empedobacter brevis]